MTKKWLYSVALGALLIAGEALGITVHEVFSHGFWSTDVEQRLTRNQLCEISDYDCKPGKVKMDEKRIFLKTTTLGKTEGGAKWRERSISDAKVRANSLDSNNRDKLVVRHKTNQEITKINEHEVDEATTENPTLMDKSRYDTTISYKNTPTKRDARPAGPYVVDDWFPRALESRYGLKSQFYGTEHNAITNIISDNEAYITGTISQTGHIDEYDGYVVNEDASLLRTYTQHVTTDADHVYVEQQITEDVPNGPGQNLQANYQTQYVATFKKGRWKGEKETISLLSNTALTDWFLRCIKRDSQNSR